MFLVRKYCFLSIFFLQAAAAQWTSDSSKNTQVSPFGMTPMVTEDGDDGAIVFFTDLSKTRAYIQRIDKNGYVKWNNGMPVRVGGYLKNQYPNAICSDGYGGAYLQYGETNMSFPGDTGKSFLFTNRIASNGKLLWNDTIGIELIHKFDGYNDYDKVLYKMVSSKKNGYYYAWIDSAATSGENNAYLKIQLVKPDGSRAFGEYGMRVTKDVPYEQVSDILDDSRGGVFVATPYRIYNFDSTGNSVYPDSGVYIPRFTYFLSKNYKGNVLICPGIEYIGLSNFANYYITLIDSAGNIQWDKKILDSVNLNIEKPKTSISNTGIINLFWRKKFSDSSYCIYCQKVDQAGNIIFNSPKEVITERVSIGNPEPFFSDSNSIIIIWPRSGLHFYALKIDLDGNPLWENSVLINSNRTFDFIHAVTQDTKGIIVIWYEVAERGGVYAQNINPNGALGSITLVNNSNYIGPVPNKFQFIGNYPNPFNPVTTFYYSIPELCSVTLKVFDLLGKEVATIVEEQTPAGSYTIPFDASKLSSGVYLYRLTAGSISETKRMLLVK